MTTNSSDGLSKRGLKTAAQLAENKPHGHRMRYMAGCRCPDCRQSNSAYETARKKARDEGDWNGIVPADKARFHIKALSEKQVGRRAVSHVSGIGETAIVEISSGRKTHIRARTEKAILSVTVAAASDHAIVPAGPSWGKLDALIADGYTKAELALFLGMKSPRLQVGKDFVTVRKAFEIERIFERLKSVDGSKAEMALNELKLEGYTAHELEQKLKELAKTLNVNLTWPLIRKGRIPKKFEDIVIKLQFNLIGSRNIDLENSVHVEASKIAPETLHAGLKNGLYRVVEDEVQKKCSKCNEYWPADKEFYYSAKDARHKDGLNDNCKACYTNYWPTGRLRVKKK